MTIDEFKEKVAPHMKEGWVAMDKHYEYWFWHRIKPSIDIDVWTCYSPNDMINLSYLFDIEPVEDWTQSLIEVGK